MIMSRVSKLQLKHFAGYLALALVTFAVQRLNFGVATWFVSRVGWVALVIYFLLMALGMFGIGPIGQTMAAAANEDGRVPWNRR
jgi:multisubunit Na+/H+ antiporter MnhG subunit